MLTDFEELARAFAEARADFPILDQVVEGHPLVYLDSAATSQKPRAVIAALSRFYERDNANVHRGLHELSTRATDAYEGARARVARYLNAADPAEIVFTRGTTEAINLVAQSWGAANLRPGDGILLTEMEHHSNIVPWQLLAERVGATVHFAPVTDEGRIDLAAFGELLGRVKIAAFTHVSNSLGTINPAAELCRMARAAGVVSLVDGAQSAGHMPVDVREIGCDFYAFSGHKTCGPTGIGALYGRAELLEAMPPWQGGGEMIAAVSFAKTTFKSAPHRFEAGTPAIGPAVGLAAALGYLDALGRDRIHAYVSGLTALAYERLARLPGLRILGPPPPRGALVAFTAEAAHPHDLTTFANTRGVALRGGHHCTQPLMRKLGLPGTTRASFHLYNTPAEVDRLAEVVGESIRFFG
jgi:cysteine desulfurase/selenocysteine lyase